MEWEQCKENIKPKREGRSISTITTTPKGTPFIAKIQERQAQFEQDIKEYIGKDELEVWIQYVKYMEDAYPEGDYLSNVGVLQFRLIKRFQDVEKYKQDSRLLDIFLNLAHHSTHATEIFSYCYHHNIVTCFSTFWLHWINSYIYLQKFDRALKVCNKAIELFKETSRFKSMKVQILHLMNASSASNAENLINVRRTGDQLSIDSSQNQLAGPSSEQGNDKASFAIFKDKTACSSSLHSISTNILETKNRNKENPQPKKQRWKNVVTDIECAPPPSSKAFSVFEENTEPDKEEQKYEKHSSALKAKKVLLSTEPALNSKFPVLKSNTNVITTVAYHKSKVYPMNGEEWSIEEIEAMRRFHTRSKYISQVSLDSSKRSRDMSSSSGEDENCELKKIKNNVSVSKPLKSCLSETSKLSIIPDFHTESTLMSSTKKFTVEKDSNSVAVMAPNFCDAQKYKDMSQLSLNLSSRSESSSAGTGIMKPIEDNLEVTVSLEKDSHSQNLTNQPILPDTNSSRNSDQIETDVSGDFTFKGLQRSIGLPDKANEFEIYEDTNVQHKDAGIGGSLKEANVIKGFFSKKKLRLKSLEKPGFAVADDENKQTFSDDVIKTCEKEGSSLFDKGFDMAEMNEFDGRPSDAFNIFKKTPEKSVEESYSLKKVNITPLFNAANASDYVPCTVEKMGYNPRGPDTQLINKEALNILNECSKITETEETEREDITMPSKDINVSYSPCFENKAEIDKANCEESNEPEKPCSKFEIFNDNESTSPEVPSKNVETCHDGVANLKKEMVVRFLEGQQKDKQNLTPILEGSRESESSGIDSLSTHSLLSSTSDGSDDNFKLPSSTYEATQFIDRPGELTRRSIEKTCAVAESKPVKDESSTEDMPPLVPDRTHRDIHLDSGMLPKVPRNSLLPTEPVTDPYDQSFIERLIMSMDPPLFYRPNFNQHSSDLAPRKTILLGGVNVTDITKIGEGAFAKVYAGTCIDGESGASEMRAFKIQAPPCPWEFYILTELIGRMEEDDAGREVMDMILPTYSIHVFNNMSVLVTSLFNEGSLLDMVNHYRTSQKKIPAAVIYTYTLDMLRCVNAIHKAGIVHGDIKPDNFLLRDKQNTMQSMSMKMSKSVVLIDFGRSIDMKILPKGSLFNVSSKTDLFECVEMQTNRPWTYQIDYYGMLSCIYLMIHNEYLTVKSDASGCWMPVKKPHRRLDQEVFSKLYKDLLNIPDCESIPSLEPYIELLENSFKKIATRLRHDELKNHYFFINQR